MQQLYIYIYTPISDISWTIVLAELWYIWYIIVQSKQLFRYVYDIYTYVWTMIIHSQTNKNHQESILQPAWIPRCVFGIFSSIRHDLRLDPPVMTVTELLKMAFSNGKTRYFHSYELIFPVKIVIFPVKMVTFQFVCVAVFQRAYSCRYNITLYSYDIWWL